MASGVNVKMGVSGVAQFKNDINKVRTSLKTLDESLKLTEKEYKATGDAESYMQTKTELLQTKLEAQKHIVADAEKALADMAANGVDKASKAFQDMQRQLLQAKGDIIDTEAQLQNVSATSGDAASNVDGMNKQLKRIGDGVNFQNVTEGLTKITDGLRKAASKAIDFGKRMVEATLDAGHWADEIMTEAKVYGITPEELQRMQKTATLIDTDVETIINAQKKLKKARAGESKDAMGAFAALGINPDTAKDAEDLFWRTGEALMNLPVAEENARKLFGETWKQFFPGGMEAEYLQEDYAQKLFGKSWAELIPLFEAGREEYEEMNASWSVVSQDQLDSLGKMDDEYNKLIQNWETFKIEILASFSGPLTEGMEKLNGLMAKFTEYLNSEEGQETMNNVITAITNSLTWITEHSGDVVSALEAIGIAFAGLKLAEAAANIGRVVSGFKGLFGGGGGTNGTPTTEPTVTGAGKGFMPNVSPLITTMASKASASLISSGAAGNLIPFGDWLVHNTGLGQEYFLGTKEKGSTFQEIGQNAADYWETLKTVAINQHEYWFGNNGIFAQQQQASEWILGDDATAEDAMAFVEGETKRADAVERNNRRLASQRQLEELTNSMDRMTRVTEDSNKNAKESDRNSLTPTDLTEFKGLPADIAAAIQKIKLSVSIDGPGLVTYINTHAGGLLTDEVQ